MYKLLYIPIVIILSIFIKDISLWAFSLIITLEFFTMFADLIITLKSSVMFANFSMAMGFGEMQDFI